jgi:hypothetical protein
MSVHLAFLPTAIIGLALATSPPVGRGGGPTDLLPPGQHFVPGQGPSLPLSKAAAAPIVACSWVMSGTRCRTAAEWHVAVSIWCDKAARSTARREDMQRRGYATNRLFTSPMGAEFARETAAEAVAGGICAADQAGLVKATAETVANMNL